MKCKKILAGLMLGASLTFGLCGGNIEAAEKPAAVLIRENRALLTGDGANIFTFLFSPEALGLKKGKFDKIYCSHGSGDLTADYIDRLLEDCAKISIVYDPERINE